jgi:hypothetical protein
VASVHTYQVIATAAGGQTATQNITLNMIDADVGVPVSGGIDAMPELPKADCGLCCKLVAKMFDNLRIWRDHQTMAFTNDGPLPPFSPGYAGEVRIDSTTGKYAVFNDCCWRVYPPKLGLKVRRASQVDCDTHTYTVTVQDSTNAAVQQNISVNLCDLPKSMFNNGSAWVASQN